MKNLMDRINKRLIIVGSSGFGLETAWLAKRSGFDICGFLDDNEELQNTKILGYKVLGKVTEWVNYSDFLFSIAIGSPIARKSVYNRMVTCSSGLPVFATIIDPTAIIGENVTVGNGCIISAGTVASVEISIGKQVIINKNCSIGHEAIIGDFSTISPLAMIGGKVKISQENEIGASASVRQGLTIGRASMLGMGSVLTKNMPANSLFYGNPAKFIKKIKVSN